MPLSGVVAYLDVNCDGVQVNESISKQIESLGGKVRFFFVIFPHFARGAPLRPLLTRAHCPRPQLRGPAPGKAAPEGKGGGVRRRGFGVIGAFFPIHYATAPRHYLTQGLPLLFHFSDTLLHCCYILFHIN